MKSFTLEELAKITGGMLTKNADVAITNIAPPLLANENTLALALGEEEIENLRINNSLKEQLGAPFLFLSQGENSIHRRLCAKLGCCMTLCVYEHDALSTIAQPLLSVAKEIRDNLGF